MMVLLRRPILVFASDVVGLAALVALLVLTGAFVAGPIEAFSSRAGGMRAELALAEAQRHRAASRLRAAETELAELRERVAREENSAPRADSLAAFLNLAANEARRVQLELLTVAPQTPLIEGEYINVDVRLSARGQSLDFVRLLDTLARSSPHQAPRSLRIDGASDPSGVCTLSWTTRVRLLGAPTGARVARGG